MLASRFCASALALILCFTGCTIATDPGEITQPEVCDLEMNLIEFVGHEVQDHNLEIRLIDWQPAVDDPAAPGNEELPLFPETLGGPGLYEVVQVFNVLMAPATDQLLLDVPAMVPPRMFPNEVPPYIEFFADNAGCAGPNDGQITRPQTTGVSAFNLDHQWLHTDACLDGPVEFEHQLNFDAVNTPESRPNAPENMVLIPSEDFFLDEEGAELPFASIEYRIRYGNALTPSGMGQFGRPRIINSESGEFLARNVVDTGVKTEIDIVLRGGESDATPTGLDDNGVLRQYHLEMPIAPSACSDDPEEAATQRFCMRQREVEAILDQSTCASQTITLNELVLRLDGEMEELVEPIPGDEEAQMNYDDFLARNEWLQVTRVDDGR